MVPWKRITEYLEDGALSPGQEILDWINESPENHKLFEEIIDIWRLTGEIPVPFTPDKSQAWEKLSSSIYKTPYRKLLRWSYRVAAILLAIALGFALHTLIGFLKPVQTVEVISPMGQKSCVVLPDGSKVTLNGGTNLKYPARFENRELNMELSGEAFFEVAGNSSREFIVNLSVMSINVTGTEFNVKSYIDDSEIEVALKEGSITLLRGQKNMATLKPNEAASYNRINGTLDIQIKDIDIITAWKNDELVFDNTPFSEVAKYLERYYGVNVKLDPALGNAHNFTFKVKTESLREILKLLNLITPINYTIEGKNVAINAPK
ncbi:MAG: hypothetical protein AMS23_01110 [Bacteroides sp. SM1_62]|nr:MAG: hypothetical protein AMS23_01110 [Bacteroides sp. SM1_62]